MTAINPDAIDCVDEDEGVYDDEAMLYVEIATRLIHEVKFIGEWVIARPASPVLYHLIRRLSQLEFSREFEEFCGDYQALREFLNDGGELGLEIS